jgi:hypothetical protein
MRLGEKIRGKSKQASNPQPLAIAESAVIGGNVYYTSGVKGAIAPGATIGGEVGHSFPKQKGKKDVRLLKAWGGLFSVFSALVVGLVLISLWRKPIIKLTDQMLKKIGTSIGWGAVIMFLTPIVAIILLITLIGLPLAMILIGLWLIALYISKILVGILVGRSILNKLWAKKKDSLIWAMIIGVLAVWLISSLPLIGWLLCLLAVWWGLGGLWMAFRKN